MQFAKILNRRFSSDETKLQQEQDNVMLRDHQSPDALTAVAVEYIFVKQSF